MDFCARNELDMELAVLLTKLLLAIDGARSNPIFEAHKTKAALAAMPFSDIDNDDLKQLFETPDYGFTEAEFDAAVDWFNIDFFNEFKFPAPPSNPLDYDDPDADEIYDMDYAAY